MALDLGLDGMNYGMSYGMNYCPHFWEPLPRLFGNLKLGNMDYLI
jgi:hypothetical protein